jgi:NitT/TauT family transport system permease protein
MKTTPRSITNMMLPVAVFLLILAVWALCVWLFGIRKFVLPSPMDVARVAMENRRALLGSMFLTGSAAILGLLASILVGSFIAFAFSQSRLVQRSLYPYAIFLQTMPIVAVAPLIILWFDFGFQSVVICAFVVSLFPIITNMTAGLTDVDENLLELFELNNATRSQVLFKLRLPNAIPSLVVGMRISSGLAVVGAIIGELYAGFGQEAYGLGYLVQVTNMQLKTDYLMAAIMASALLGLIIFTIVGAIGDYATRAWKQNRG